MEQNAVVITADVVASSKINESQRPLMLQTLQKAAAIAQQIVPDMQPEIFQGDSLQAYTTTHLDKGLRIALTMQMLFIESGFRLRTAVGLGVISFFSGESLSSDGTAFQLSGRNLEQMKHQKEAYISIGSDEANRNAEWTVHSKVLSHCLAQCTKKQAEVLQLAMQGNTQQQIANQLQIRQPAVTQRLQAANWQVYKAILTRFETIF